MRLAQIKTAGRRAFTLIELLVVIAIIAILIGLLSAAVMKALGKGKQTQNMDEIHQMANAIAAFKEKYKVDYVPSRFRLRETLSGYFAGGVPVSQLDADSIEYLKRLWPRIGPTVDWNLDGSIAAGNAYVDLEGDQCLVFFLGGVFLNGGVMGFSTNPANPMLVGGDRVGPLYEFKTERLTVMPVGTSVGVGKRSPIHPSYLDVYRTMPYLYFSAYKTSNGYNRYYNNNTKDTANYYPASDCLSACYWVTPPATTSSLQPPATNPGVVSGVWPYAEVLGVLPRYQNPSSFQIVSAGADRKFGSGTVITNGPPLNVSNGQVVWTGGPTWSSATATGTTTGDMRDDQSNFSGSVLEAGN